MKNKGFKTWAQKAQHPSENIPQPPLPADIAMIDTEYVLSENASNLWVVIAQNSSPGARVIGPFHSHAAALEWFSHDAESGVWTYRIAELESP